MTIAIWAMLSAVAAQAPATPEGVPMDLTRAADLLMESGHYEDAAKLLDVLEKANPADSGIRFRIAMLAVQQGRIDAAIDHFRRILTHEPNSVRVRLELGRAYFLKKDYVNADRQFRFARAGRLPAAVNANIDRYLRQIRLLKRFSYGFSVAIAPDSNLNAGPAIDAVSLYGVPFQLDAAARRQSGVGLAVQGNVEWAFRIAPVVKLRVGGQMSRSQYSQSAFNDMTALVYVGPRISLRKWDVDATLIVQRRWYGDRPYMNAYGGSIGLTRYLSTRTAVSSSVAVSRLAYPGSSFQDGTSRSLTVSLAHTPTTASVVQGSVTIGRQGAADPAFANDSRQFSMGYSREFKGGLTMAVAPAFSLIQYQAAQAAFGRVRSDRQVSVSTSILNRRISFRGLTPKLTYSYTANLSNIDLYEVNRSRFEIGVTRVF